MRKTVIYVMMYLVCGVTAAQTPLTLDECRSMALKNNVKMRNASNEVEAAVQGQKEAFTNYFPNVSASGMAYNANKGLLQMEMGPGMSMSLLKNGIMGGITVTQPVFAGRTDCERQPPCRCGCRDEQGATGAERE